MLNDVVEILSQCCKGLARAHAAGIVHRDIKPDNIFLARAPDEDREVVKILDFGVAKITLAEGGSTGQTGTGAVLGTPLYMSPEQARGPNVDHRTDLWSLAMVAYFALTGLLAIGGETFGDVLLKICVEPLPSLRAGLRAAPLDGPWFQQACAREPAERFQAARRSSSTPFAPPRGKRRVRRRVTPPARRDDPAGDDAVRRCGFLDSWFSARARRAWRSRRPGSRRSIGVWPSRARPSRRSSGWGRLRSSCFRPAITRVRPKGNPPPGGPRQARRCRSPPRRSRPSQTRRPRRRTRRR